jgi:general secretion pathway protein E
MGIYEVVDIDDQMRNLIHQRAGELELETYARQCGPSIHADGVAKILAGVTSVEEVLRVTHREK